MNTVLIVHEQQGVLRALRDLTEVLVHELGRSPAEVRVASSRKEAIEQIEEKDIDLLLVSQDLTGENGAEFIRSLPVRPPQMIAVLMVEDPEALGEILEETWMAIDFVVEMPMSRDQIKLLLAAFLSRRRSIGGLGSYSNGSSTSKLRLEEEENYPHDTS